MEAERAKILSGEYPSRIQRGKQRKHIEGTREFAQKRASMKRDDPDNEPAILGRGINAQELVDRYKGTGRIAKHPREPYPIETIQADRIIGKTWVKRLRKYVSTTFFRIVYSGNGVHIYPVNARNLNRRL